MAIFEGKDQEDSEEEFRDLKPENRKKRRELPKPWGKKERYTVLVFLLVTVFVSGVLAASSRNWKLPGLPQIKIPNLKNFNFDFLEGETIIIGKPFDSAQGRFAEKAEGMKRQFEEKTKNLSGVYALDVIDLTSGYSFGVNEDEVIQAASLIKLPVMAAIYREAEAGKINLDNQPQGSNWTFRQLAEEMGKKSNNQAQAAAVKVLGQEKIQAVIDDFGMKETSSSENETTADDIGLFFQKLWRSEVVSEKSRDEILGYLTDTIYEDWIKAGLPAGIRLAHKFGREVHVVNDAGIVFSRRPFVLVIMSQGIIEKEADIVIPEITSLVFREFR